MKSFRTAVSNADEMVRRALERAAGFYRQALDLDADHADARLRIIWIHLVLDDSRAPDDVAAFLAVARRPEDRHLGRCFAVE